MTQRQRKHKEDMEIESLKAHLLEQDEILKEQNHKMDILDRSMKEILGLLKGSAIMDSKGLIAGMKEMKDSMGVILTDLQHLQRWKKLMQDSKGTLTIRLSVLFTRALAIIGGLGTIVAIALGLKELMERHQQ